jgi:hypothetical protein
LRIGVLVRRHLGTQMTFRSHHPLPIVTPVNVPRTLVDHVGELLCNVAYMDNVELSADFYTH